MGKVQVEINQKLYPVGCEDGQDRRVLELGRMLDAHVTQLVSDLGQISELKLMLMGALMLADELVEAREKLDRGEAELARLRSREAARDQAVIEDIQAARLLDAAAARLEAISDRVATASGA